MRKELTPKEIKYKLNFTEEKDINMSYNDIPQIESVYKKIDRALNIEKEGYNLYLIDSFSKDKVNELINHIRNYYSAKEAPKDICYVTLDDEKKPEVVMAENGNGRKLQEVFEELKEAYLGVIEDFYSNSSEGDKDELIDEFDKKRNHYVNDLMKMAKTEGFEVKASNNGFAFVPLSDGEVMTEKEYDDLDQDEKDELSEKASSLKKRAEYILEKLKDIEDNSIKQLKGMYSDFLTRELEEVKDNALLEFINDDNIYEFLERFFVDIEDAVIECYTMSIENDEDELSQIINKYKIQVLVDNSLNSTPVVIYEEDPTINNLMGSVEYESNNGVYTTDISLINSGSLLRANEGCLILSVSSLANNPYSYYYLKKALVSSKITYDTSRNYAELISISGLKPKPISINTKVILIGDYETYDILYNSDEEFKRIFPLKAEFNEILDIDNNIVLYVKNYIKSKKEINGVRALDEEAVVELIKYLSRKASNKNKLNIDDFEIDRILILSNDYAKERKSDFISKYDVRCAAYEEESIEEEYIKIYKEKKILISVKEKKVGAINALAVLGTGYYSFGKPMRVTCICYKGTGRVIDIHKESRLSGKIHEKSINILEGLLSNLLNPYEELPVDFHLSFEQTYGMIEGDSASVAEIICLLSALSKRGIRQNIAVTGSLNQFGEVQVIGGVNEKIEGFFKVCKLIDTVKDKGVLIPSGNKDELILLPEVEDAIEKGEFHVYTMESLNDAIETLILEEDETIEEFFELINVELEKYIKKENCSTSKDE